MRIYLSALLAAALPLAAPQPLGTVRIVTSIVGLDGRTKVDTLALVSLAAAPVSTEPVYDPTKGVLIYRDNMDQYTTSTAMGVVPASRYTTPVMVPLPSPWGDGRAVDTNATQVISPGRGGSGKALRLSFSGLYQSASQFSLMNVTPAPDMTTHVWTYWARLGGLSAFVGPHDALAVKWFLAWHRKKNNTRIQWDLHDHLPWNGGKLLTYWQVYDQGATTSQGIQPVGPYFKDIVDGAWHRYTYTFRPNSVAGARDGFTRMWIDGVKVIDISAATMGVTPPGGEKAWCNGDDIDNLAVSDGIVDLVWGSVQTTVSPAWTLDIDDFIWWRVP